MTLQIFATLMASILGFAGTVVSTALFFCIRGMDARIEKLEAAQKELIKQPAECKDKFVDLDQYVRSEAVLRSKLDKIGTDVATLVAQQNIGKEIGECLRTLVHHIVSRQGGPQS